MLEKIVNRGQAGVDEAARRIAIAFGLRTGGATTTMSPGDVDPRLEDNVRESDATLWLGLTASPEAQSTVQSCLRLGRPCLPIDPCASFDPPEIARWIVEHQVKTLNVTGNREEDEPGSGERAERLLTEVLVHLGHIRA
jgi:hypothetical protein